MNKCGQDIEIEIRVLNEESKKYAENFRCGNLSIDYYFNNEAVNAITDICI